jgi:integrase
MRAGAVRAAVHHPGRGCGQRREFRNRVWEPAVRAVDGVPSKMRFHDLRHAFATSYAGGVPFKEITVLLGQSSPGETERYVR